MNLDRRFTAPALTYALTVDYKSFRKYAEVLANSEGQHGEVFRKYWKKWLKFAPIVYIVEACLSRLERKGFV